jgi:hypothetical protein
VHGNRHPAPIRMLQDHAIAQTAIFTCDTATS